MAKMSRRSWPSMGRERRHHHLAFVLLLVLVAVGICVPVFALVPSLSSPQSLHQDEKVSMILLIASCWLRDSASEPKSMWKCREVNFKSLCHSRCALFLPVS